MYSSQKNLESLDTIMDNFFEIIPVGSYQSNTQNVAVISNFEKLLSLEIKFENNVTFYKTNYKSICEIERKIHQIQTKGFNKFDLKNLKSDLNEILINKPVKNLIIKDLRLRKRYDISNTCNK